MSEASLLPQIGGGALIGFIAGYLTKKLVKLALLLAAGVAYLQHEEYVGYIDWSGITETLAAALNPTELIALVQSVAPAGTGFTVAAAVGFKRG